MNRMSHRLKGRSAARPLAIAALCVVVTLVAGCGNSSSQPPRQQPPVTDTRLVWDQGDWDETDWQ